MKRLLGGGLLLLVLVGVAGPAGAAPAPKLTGAGTVEGDLKAGSVLTVRLHVEHSQGWQHVQEIDIDLVLQDSTLDQVQFAPTQSSLSVLGGAQPLSLGQTAQLTGAYFQVNPARVSLSAQGNRLRVTLPITMRTAPPPGARLTFDATAVPVATIGPKSLTPPVKSNSGFSWGTLGLAIAVALFAGGFFGNVFASRRRPPARPSVYSAVQRKLEEERVRQ